MHGELSRGALANQFTPVTARLAAGTNTGLVVAALHDKSVRLRQEGGELLLAFSSGGHVRTARHLIINRLGL